MQPKLLSNSIVVIEDAVSQDFCHQTIANFEADESKEPGQTAFGANEIKKSLDLLPSDADLWDGFNETIDAYIEKLILACQKIDGFHFGHIAKHLPLSLTMPQIQCCRPNGKDGYGWHTDSTPGDRRVLSGLIYLNTVSNGGETEFLEGDVIKSVEGRAVLFAPYWNNIHRGKSTTSRSKYVVTWFVETESRASQF